MKEHHNFRNRVSQAQMLLGLLQMHPNPLLVETAGQYGYDFLLLDGEHGAFSETDYAQTLKALAATDVLAMVRLAGHDTQALDRYLGMGADAIVVPHVSTAEQARTLARAAGLRKRASLIVIIESALGVANAEEILAVEGVEGAIVGPNDLSMELGHKGDYARPTYTDALSRIEQVAAMTGKVLGTVPHGQYSLAVLRARGHRLFVLGSDRSLLQEAMSAQITKARSTLGIASSDA